MIGTASTSSGKKRVTIDAVFSSPWSGIVGEHEPEQHRARVAHEDPRGIEVVAQEAERRAEHDRGEDRGLDFRPRQRERDQREGERRRSPQTPAARPSSPSRKLTMFMIATIQRTDSGIPTQSGSSWMPRNGNVKRCDPDAEADRDRGRSDLAAELLPPAQPAEVVDRADRRRDRGAEQEPAHLAREVEERERRDEDPEEEREAAEAGHGAAVEAPPLRPVDDAEQPGHAADRRGQQHDDRRSEQRAPDDLEVIGKRRRSMPLLRAVEPVARVAETGHDEAALVEAAVDRGDDDLHVRMVAS